MLTFHPRTPLTAGKLTGQSSNGKSFSTIPSKFETTLFTGNKERDGFGSRAHRFIDVEVSSDAAAAALIFAGLALIFAVPHPPRFFARAERPAWARNLQRA